MSASASSTPGGPATAASPPRVSPFHQPKAVWAVAFACVISFMGIGLVETRARSLEDGITALRGALSTALGRPDGTLDDCCETVTQELGPHGEDDVTLVLARINAGP